MATELVISCALVSPIKNLAYIKNIESTFRHLLEDHNQIPNVGEQIIASGYINGFGLDENHKPIKTRKIFHDKVFKLVEKMYETEYDIISSEYQRKINLFIKFEEIIFRD